MRQFIAFLRVNVKSVITPYSVLAALVLAVSLAIGSYVEKELYLRADVGVYHENTSISKEIVENLRLFSNLNVIEYDDEDALRGDVASRKIECGYAISGEIDGYIRNGSINRGVTLYKSPATVAEGFTNELIFAALLKTAAPYISANFLNAGGSGDYDTLLHDAKEGINAYYGEGIFLDVQIIPVGGVGEQGSASRKNTVNAGILSVFIFILLFHAAIRGAEEKKRGLFEKLSKREGFVYLTSFFGAQGLFVFAVSLQGLFFIITENGPAHTLLALAAYTAALSAIALAAAVCLKSPRGLYALLPVISAAVITLGGAFFDLGEIVPALGGVSRLFPTYYFVRAVL